MHGAARATATSVSADCCIPAGLRLGPVPGTFKLGKYLSDRREPGPKKKIFYRALRDVQPGEELTVWYSNSLAQWFDIPTIATPTHDEKGEERYICWYCWRTFRYPNSLKAHLRFHCVLSSGGARAYLHHEHTARQGAAPAADGLRLSPKPPAPDFAAAAPAGTLRAHPQPGEPKSDNDSDVDVCFTDDQSDPEAGGGGERDS
ncbi:hypothetical protein E2I00_000729 [Balaenoptera physalus]|uniref:C2H2-type domain-containing protein n=1 Tax=Balaenoptera physalus TaxID=9770 RepID=A0A643CCW8_BALPH|nr:hypothetical protein E2I00_000729 [Balaenoptera physalus]